MAVSFFAADVQAGAGPLLGIYLQAHGWSPGSIGTVLTLGAIVSVLGTAPAGALVDAISHRRVVVVVASAMTVAAACVIGPCGSPRARRSGGPAIRAATSWRKWPTSTRRRCFRSVSGGARIQRAQTPHRHGPSI
ncbi:MFS transporter [Paraburkholderia podalyriae]|uniref:MFS transporter n=1 Tax=Paraburkholderia sp. WC7.3d TaxID=2991069 RepID=UPI0024836F74